MQFLLLLNKLLLPRDKRVLGLLLALAVLVSIIETVSITAIMVFISIATNFDQIITNRYYAWAYRFLGCSSPAQFVMILGIGLALFYLLRGILNIIHIYIMGHFSYTRYQRFATLLFSRFLRFSYQDYVSKNSATMSQAIFSYTGTLTQLVFALLTMSAELFTVACVYAMLFFVNWKMTIVLTCFLTVKSLLIIKAFSRSVARAGKNTQKYSLAGSKIFNESFGNYKLIKLHGHEPATAERLAQSTRGFAGAQIVYTTLQNAPRFVLETIGFVLLVSIILYVIYRHNNAAFVIPIVSLYALAFYRLLPSMNKILASVNQIQFAQHSLQGVYDFLQLPTEALGKQTIDFKSSIAVKNVCFEYLPQKPVLRDVSLAIHKGERVAFVGPSGSGKSTMADVLMGLYSPQHGVISIDGVVLDDDHRCAWRQKIGYIPQSIYLFDGTIADNVVFGREYDEQKIIAALTKAQIYDFLQTQQGLVTRVGEGGIKLSGGQKQRVAIARALYDNPELLMLDEATSALDHDTESSIMNQIYALGNNVTLVIVAHRLSTVARCNKIYKIDQGCVQEVAFADLVPSHHEQQVHQELA